MPGLATRLSLRTGPWAGLPAAGVLLHGELIGFLQVRTNRAPIGPGAQHGHVDNPIGGHPANLEEARRCVLTVEIEGQAKAVPHEDEIRKAARGPKERVTLS